MVFQKQRVELYSSEEEFSNYSVDISVYNVHLMDGEDLNKCFHEAEYNFDVKEKFLNNELEKFREECLFSWYGEKISPIVADFGENLSVSLLMPNSLLHENTMEKVKATEFAEAVGDQLESYLEESQRNV